MKLSRRTFLRAAGVSLALPLLEVRAAGAPAAPAPRRMVCINTPLGLHPAAFFPEKAGRDYALSPYLEVVKDFRDAVREQANDVRSAVGARDRDKLDEYFTCVRELEQRLAQSEAWAKRPKPKVSAKPPQDVTNPTDLIGKTRVWFDLIHLALQT